MKHLTLDRASYQTYSKTSHHPQSLQLVISTGSGALISTRCVTSNLTCKGPGPGALAQQGLLGRAWAQAGRAPESKGCRAHLHLVAVIKQSQFFCE